MFKRVFLIVLDSLGIGALPDADKFGDSGSNTLRSLTRSKELNIPTLKRMGIFNIRTAGLTKYALNNLLIANFGAMAEKSKGKDTTTGHWELAGIISEKPLPTYPNGFPNEVINAFCLQTGKEILCNKPYSGTEVIKNFGDEHIKTGKLIVYTSADSVFQIAAHEKVVPIRDLYKYCRIARNILQGEHAVGRVIARPFSDKNGEYFRTNGRHDYSLEPYKETMLDIIKERGMDVISVGKINDIFASKGITESNPTKTNTEGQNLLLKFTKREFNGLCFANLVDFDMVYGHRRNIDGYAKALTEFDVFLISMIEKLSKDDLLIITADHGCDPGFKGTDHTREYVPLIVYGKNIKNGVDLGIRKSFSDIAVTVTEAFGVKKTESGVSFLSEIT